VATITAVRSGADSGLRPTDLRRDLGGIAALMETCFGAGLDAAGRGAIHEMRALSRAGPLLWLLGGALPGPMWSLGFVWAESGRIVGNISTQRSSAHAHDWLIANVAVHPDFRRRGIARALTEAALGLARKQGGQVALLQVNHDNAAALALYTQLGFARYGSRTEWARYGGSVPPYQPTPAVEIRPRQSGHWPEEYNLACQVCPEGLDWMHPLQASQFRPALLRTLGRLLVGQGEERWVALVRGRLVASLIIASNPGESDHLTLLLHPEWRERVAQPLLVRGLRRLGHRPWPVRIDHPPHAETETLRNLGFSAGRTLVWMRQNLH
jgi:GNAT superfamily N-acetyltransferase